MKILAVIVTEFLVIIIFIKVLICFIDIDYRWLQTRLKLTAIAEKKVSALALVEEHIIVIKKASFFFKFFIIPFVQFLLLQIVIQDFSVRDSLSKERNLYSKTNQLLFQVFCYYLIGQLLNIKVLFFKIKDKILLQIFIFGSFFLVIYNNKSDIAINNSFFVVGF